MVDFYQESMSEWSKQFRALGLLLKKGWVDSYMDLGSISGKFKPLKMDKNRAKKDIQGGCGG